MLSPRLYVAQRLSAVLMAPLVLGHLAVMIYAIQGGLDSAEILSRTQGSLFWFTFYQLFVIAVSIHAALGVRVVAFEWCGIRDRALELLSWATGLILLGTGTFAVAAVVLK